MAESIGGYAHLARRVTGWALLLTIVVCTAFCTAWLAAGAAAAVVVDIGAAHHWAEVTLHSGHAAGWLRLLCRGLLADEGRLEPGSQAILDYLFSLINVAGAAVTLRLRPRDVCARLLALGMICSAGAFNLQAHATLDTISIMYGLRVDWWHVLLLHSVGGVAYVYALILFPDGRMEIAHRARWAVRALLALGIAGAAALLSYSTADYPHTLSFVVFFGLLIPVAGVAAQLHRYATATTTERRQQSRVMLWALVLAFAVALVLGLVIVILWARAPGAQPAMSGPGAEPGMSGPGAQLAMSGSSAAVFWVLRGVFAVIPLALLAALLRFRLWDIEKLFNRALVYGTLAAGATGLYVAVVVVADALTGTAGPPGTAARAAGVAAAALLADPLRRRVEHAIDKIVYGSRPPPNEVLSRLATLSRQAMNEAEALPAIARVAAEGLAVRACTVRLQLTSHAQLAYHWPPGAPPAGDPGVAADIVFNGERLGRLELYGPPREAALGRRRSRLFRNLAQAAGPMLHNARLGIELARQLPEITARAAEIEASRRRIAARADGERRALERNLHDGAQQQLVAAQVRLAMAARLLAGGDPAAAQELLTEIGRHTASSVRDLEDLAQGLFPPLLVEQGVVAALRAQAGAMPQPVIFELAGEVAGTRFAADTEAAVYFTCLEALQNAAKHAPGSRVTVRMRTGDGGLSFAVADDGPGFDPASAAGGSGLQSISDRVAAVGGELAVRSSPGSGTEITATVPAGRNGTLPAGSAMAGSGGSRDQPA